MSARRDDSVYLDHIRDSISRVASYLDGIDEAKFMRTPLIQDAVMRQIQIIGEAANRLSAEYTASTAAIPWRDITGMRHKLVHDYMGVDLEAVWETAVRDLPALRAELNKLR
jgi:uncharacterized protein with HEPN domain